MIILLLIGLSLLVAGGILVAAGRHGEGTIVMLLGAAPIVWAVLAIARAT